MSIFDGFPLSNAYSVNLDWIIKNISELCKRYPNDFKTVMESLEAMRERVDILDKDVQNFDENYIRKLVSEFIPAMIYPEISNAGYIVFNIPATWENIVFNTTGVDIVLEQAPEYGHLVLSY